MRCTLLGGGGGGGMENYHFVIRFEFKVFCELLVGRECFTFYTLLHVGVFFKLKCALI